MTGIKTLTIIIFALHVSSQGLESPLLSLMSGFVKAEPGCAASSKQQAHVASVTSRRRGVCGIVMMKVLQRNAHDGAFKSLQGFINIAFSTNSLKHIFIFIFMSLVILNQVFIRALLTHQMWNNVGHFH